MFYVLYRFSKKGKSNSDGTSIASLFISVWIFLILMNVDIVFIEFLNVSFLIEKPSNYVIPFVVAVFVSVFLFFNIGARYKKIENKYSNVTSNELNKLIRRTIVLYSIVVSFFMVCVFIRII